MPKTMKSGNKNTGFIFCKYPYKPDDLFNGSYAHRAGADLMPQNAASDQGLLLQEP